MSDTYGSSGASSANLIQAIQASSLNAAGTLNSIRNVWPAATTTTSPFFIAINNLSTTGTTVMTGTTGLSGLIVVNPGNATAYLYGLNLATTPTLSSLGGTIPILPLAHFEFPSIYYANFNNGLGALVATGSAAPLTLLQFF